MIDLHSPLRIGNITLKNRLILAPVDGVFDRAYRSIALPFGPGLTHSEMVSARTIKFGSERVKEKHRGVQGENPYSLQLADHDPAILSEAARWVEGENIAQIVDINMGCPSRTVTKSGNGSALMRSPELVADIIRTLRKAISLPLTVKMRAGWDDSHRNAVEIAKIVEAEGADWVTIHGRTRSQVYGGKSDKTIIAKVKEALKIPVIANGDILSSDACKQIIRETNCDAVMIARGAFGNPWLIKRILEDNDQFTPTLSQRRDMILNHLDAQCQYDPEIHAVKKMRKHFVWYVKSLPGAAEFRRAVMTLRSRLEVENLVNNYFAKLTED